MLVGYLGDIVFAVAKNYVRTFDDYNRSGAGRWQTHELIGRKPVLEFLGADLEKISFKMQLRSDQGVDPEDEAQKLRKMRDAGTPCVLVLNGAPVGDNYWIVESLGEEVTYWNAYGKPLSITVDVSLKEYIESLVV